MLYGFLFDLNVFRYWYNSVLRHSDRVNNCFVYFIDLYIYHRSFVNDYFTENGIDHCHVGNFQVNYFFWFCIVLVEFEMVYDHFDLIGKIVIIHIQNRVEIPNDQTFLQRV